MATDFVKKRWQALVVLSIVQLVLVIDDGLVNVAVPSVQRDLGFSQAGLAWVNSSYVLVFGGLLLVGGRLGDLYGRRRVFHGGVILFGLASLACGLSQEAWQLIAARAVQGVGAALISPAALALITMAFTDGKERGKAFAFWGITAGVGGLLGVILGGVLTDLVSWRLVFLINVPFALIVAVFTPYLVAESRDEKANRPDLPGSIAGTAGIALLIYGLLQLSDPGANKLLLPSFAVSAILLGTFVAIQLKGRNPLVPKGFMRHRVRTTAFVTMLLMSGAIMAQFFGLSLYLQQVLGFSPLTTGLALAPQAVISFLFFPLAGPLINWLGLRIALPAGLAIMAVGFFLLSDISTDSSYWTAVLPSLAIMAAGGPLSFTAITTAAMGDAGDEAGLASGVVDAAQEVGIAIGLAMFVTLSASTAGKAGRPDPVSEASGLGTAFLVGAIVLVVIAVGSFVGIGKTDLQVAPMGGPPPGEVEDAPAN
ncbi:MFS transporter [Amycolatopsis speibonae]|uniref:MFS transporter n=1 Tax=Amycolatopsis speibonae TaxID=1450224 RepID=A0ABV7NP48_9PSEU